MPSFDMGGSSPTPAGLAVESDPPGAQASAAGSSCVTPCRLNVATNGSFTVNVALDGYVPQSVPVRIVQPDDPRLGSDDTSAGGIRLDPNPVYVELERASPAAAPKTKKKAAKHPATAENHSPAAAQPAPSGPTTASAPVIMAPPAAPPPAQTAGTPWPMPR
jgi:PEGA domain-containing protein